MGNVSDAYKAQMLDLAGVAVDDGGYVKFYTTGNAEVAHINLNADAFAAATGTGTVYILANQSPALMDNDADGNLDPITKASCKTAANAEVFTFTVGNLASNADCKLSNPIVSAHDALVLTSLKVKMETV